MNASHDSRHGSSAVAIRASARRRRTRRTRAAALPCWAVSPVNRAPPPNNSSGTTPPSRSQASSRRSTAATSRRPSWCGVKISSERKDSRRPVRSVRPVTVLRVRVASATTALLVVVPKSRPSNFTSALIIHQGSRQQRLRRRQEVAEELVATLAVFLRRLWRPFPPLLHEVPRRLAQVGHKTHQSQAPQLVLVRLATQIQPEQRRFIFGGQLEVGREVAEVEESVPRAGILPID